LTIFGPVPTGALSHKQSAWDRPGFKAARDSVERGKSDPWQKAAFLAASSRHSGDWLLALSIASCGLRLIDDAVRMSEERLFRAAEPTTQNAWFPKSRLVRGKTRSLRTAERRAARVEMVVTGTHGSRMKDQARKQLFSGAPVPAPSFPFFLPPLFSLLPPFLPFSLPFPSFPCLPLKSSYGVWGAL